MSTDGQGDRIRGLAAARRLERTADLCRTSRRQAKDARKSKARWRTRRQLKKLRQAIIALQATGLAAGLSEAHAEAINGRLDSLEADLGAFLANKPSKRRLAALTPLLKAHRRAVDGLLPPSQPARPLATPPT